MTKPHHVVPLFSEAEIKAKVAELARTVAADYYGKELVLVGILHGGAALITDFARELWHAGLTTTVYKDYIGFSSYESGVDSTGVAKLTKELKNPIAGRDVLIVEDIVDTGRSLKEAIDLLNAKEPKSLESLALLSKPSRREVEVSVKYVGWEIPNTFVVGYDLDYNEIYRNMPYIGRVVFD
jgi:hypoxanthine phosphoribosyltransferase